MERKFSIAIIGGGASGLAAAISAAEAGQKSGHPVSITIFEKNPRIGKKLLATGNGRCNLSNRNSLPERYHGSDRNFILPAFREFPVKSNLDFFFKMGLPVVEEEDGKLYPRSLQAAAVLDVLRLECVRLGVELRCDSAVERLNKEKGGFSLEFPDGKFFADVVILAAGGVASSSLGGTDSGYRLLERLGGKITPLLPSIVQLKADMNGLKGLSGTKVDGYATLFLNGKQAARQFGELLFTDYGISGPPVLQLSGIASRALEAGEKPVLLLDLVPEMEAEALFRMLKGRRTARPEKVLEDFLTGFLHKRIAFAVMKLAGIAPLSRLAESLTEQELRELVGQLKGLRLTILDTNGMKNAQVTAGGAVTSQYDPETLEARFAPKLFVCGEVLDIDGDCGGFNLQWAWSSGRLAGRSAFENCKK